MYFKKFSEIDYYVFDMSKGFKFCTSDTLRNCRSQYMYDKKLFSTNLVLVIQE